jgi:hypothetical protein
MNIYHVTPTGWVLEDDSPYWRKPTRPEKLQDNLFRKQFDYQTIIYDCFYSADKKYAICICPPFNNLEPYIRSMRITAVTPDDRKYLCSKPDIIQLKNCAELWIELPNNISDILCFETKMGNIIIRIGENLCHLCRNKKVIFTKQKNNEISVIVDWINCNIALHSIEAVILFDNGSDKYSIQTLANTINSQTNIETLIICEWEYTFGPTGGISRPRLLPFTKHKNIPYDSTFLQHGILQCCYWRFLQDAKAVIQCDIDEILITEDGENIFDKLLHSDTGVLYAEDIRLKKISNKFYDDNIDKNIYFYLPVQIRRTPATKYVFIPARINRGCQLNVHEIIFVSDQNTLYDTIRNMIKNYSLLRICLLPPLRLLKQILRKILERFVIEQKDRKYPKDVGLRHFRWITQDWKAKPDARTIYNPRYHIFDCALVKSFEAVSAIVHGGYPLEEILSFARDIGACPRSDSLPHLNFSLWNCTICPYNKSGEV